MNSGRVDTLDLDAIKSAVDDNGYCVIPDALSADELAAARELLERVRREDETAGVTMRYGPNKSNQRVWCVLNRDEGFVNLAIHPVLVAVMRKLLGYETILLSTISSNITGPGGDTDIGVLHNDQGFLPIDFWPRKVVFNSAFFLDDYTEENGATVFVPGSHRSSAPPSVRMEPSSKLGYMTGRAGSLAVWDGYIHHATGLNRTANQERRGVITTYCAPFLRTQENWCLSLDRSLLEKYPSLAEFAGFHEFSTMGGVNGGIVAKAGLNY